MLIAMLMTGRAGLRLNPVFTPTFHIPRRPDFSPHLTTFIGTRHARGSRKWISGSGLVDLDPGTIWTMVQPSQFPADPLRS